MRSSSRLFKRWSKPLSQVTELEEIVVAGTESSIDRARQPMERAERPRLRDVIARDARGVLNGMWIGFEYARMPGALIGAAIDAGAGSSVRLCPARLASRVLPVALRLSSGVVCDHASYAVILRILPSLGFCAGG